MIARLAAAAAIRAGEGRILALVALLFTAIEAGRGFGEVGVDTLVVRRLRTQALPYLFVGLGATVLVTALAYGAALGRVSRTPLLVGVLLGGATLLVLGRLAIAAGGRVRVPARRRDRSAVADLRMGFDEVVRSPLFRLVAIAYVLFSILETPRRHRVVPGIVEPLEFCQGLLEDRESIDRYLRGLRRAPASGPSNS